MSILFTLSNQADLQKIYIVDNTNDDSTLFQYEARCDKPSIPDTTDTGQIFTVSSMPSANLQTLPVYNVSTESFLASSGFATANQTFTGETAGGITFLPAAEKLLVKFELVTGTTYHLSIEGPAATRLYLTYDEGSNSVSWLNVSPVGQIAPPLYINWQLTKLPTPIPA